MNPEFEPLAEEQSSAFLNARRVLRERWWVILLATLICAAAALGQSLSSTKQYEATAKLLLRKSSLSTAVVGTDVFPSSIDPQRDTTTDILLITSGEVARGVKQSLQSREPASTLAGKVKVASEQNADVIDVTARDTSPTQSARLANAFASQYVAFRRNADRQNILQGEQLLRQRLASLQPGDTADRTALQAALQKLSTLEAVQTGNAEIVQRASVPGSPAAPRPKRDLLLGLLLGLGLGTALAFLLDYIDRRVKSPEEFERLYGLRSLVNIPQTSFRSRTPQTRGPAFEPYRILRSSLAFAAVDREVRVVLVTSSVLGEGKTTVAVNLARAAALSGEQVVLIEADLRRPSFHEHFPIEQSVGGLTNAVIGGGTARDFVQYDVLGIPNLGVLPSGPLPPSSAEILRSASMGVVLRDLAETAELVIVDAPPLLPVADAQILLDRPEVDSCLIVARAYFTKRDQVRRTRAVLDQHRVTALGLAVTGLRDTHTYEYYGSSSRGELIPGEPDGRRQTRRQRREARTGGGTS